MTLLTNKKNLNLTSPKSYFSMFWALHRTVVTYFSRQTRNTRWKLSGVQESQILSITFDKIIFTTSKTVQYHKFWMPQGAAFEMKSKQLSLCLFLVQDKIQFSMKRLSVLQWQICPFENITMFCDFPRYPLHIQEQSPYSVSLPFSSLTKTAT